MGFFADEKFLIPFLSTLGAALTVITLQFIHRYVNDKKKKIYAIGYIMHDCFGLLQSNLILKKHTIIPHIDAVKKIIGGDEKLLNTIFLADEFDILTDEPIDIDHLSEEYKTLLGSEDISLVKSYETLIFLNKNIKTSEVFNDFVKNNLKSEHFFKSQSPDKQIDVLKIYWDYLDKIRHETDRNIFFILEIILPSIKKYINRKQFLLFSTKGIKTLTNKVENSLTNFQDVLPEKDYLNKAISGGIQKAL
jgi:hypothetical protein